MLECTVLVRNQNTSSNTQISIKPSMPNTTTIQLNANFKVTSLLFLRHRLDLQAWGVGMGANDGDTVSRLVLLTNGKGNYRATITGKVVFTTTLDLSIIPAITFFDFSESSLKGSFVYKLLLFCISSNSCGSRPYLAQKLGCLVSGMERRWGSVNKVDEL